MIFSFCFSQTETPLDFDLVYRKLNWSQLAKGISHLISPEVILLENNVVHCGVVIWEHKQGVSLQGIYQLDLKLIKGIFYPVWQWRGNDLTLSAFRKGETWKKNALCLTIITIVRPFHLYTTINLCIIFLWSSFLSFIALQLNICIMFLSSPTHSKLLHKGLDIKYFY